MLKYLLFALTFLTMSNAFADSVILMIGDGMGNNHIQCIGQKNNLFLGTISPQMQVRTASADNPVTDSAASATSYSCGIKTNNGYLGMDAEQSVCKTIAEAAEQQGKDVYILSSDNDTGATPSAFYAHVNSRYNNKEILKYKEQAAQKMHIFLNEKEIDKAVENLLTELRRNPNQYFVMIEEAYIDKCSHNNDYQCMEKALKNFDKAVKKVFDFAEKHKDVHIFVTADHETGGLTADCQYTTKNHTASDVSLYVKNAGFTDTDMGKIENTEIYNFMQSSLNW